MASNRVGQGGVLCLTIFNNYTDGISGNIFDLTIGETIGYWQINHLRYFYIPWKLHKLILKIFLK